MVLLECGLISLHGLPIRVADARPPHPAPLTFAVGSGRPPAGIRFGRREGQTDTDIIWRFSTTALPALGRNATHLPRRAES